MASKDRSLHNSSIRLDAGDGLLTIDGSYGEGGGQILRSSLALAMVTGTPFRIEKIRAGRRKPGLMRQHLGAVRAAAKVCSAQVDGDEVGSRALSFRPGEIQPGTFHFPIGTAGSTTLVAQTILPALVSAKGPSTVTIEGGTHNPMAPPFDFFARTFLPVLKRMAPTVTARLETPGFAPAGGGRFHLDITPAEDGQLRGIELLERGKVRRRAARAVVSNLPRHIATREQKVLQKQLGWPPECFSTEEWSDATGPGNIVLVELESESHCEVFTAFGEVRKPAEAVAKSLVRQVRRYLKGSAPVGEYLTDQIMLPLALAGGGAFRSTGLSLHATTHLELIRLFLELPVSCDEIDDGEVIVRFG